MQPTRLSRKKLQMELQDLISFTHPKQYLEQYPTSAHVATDIIFDIQQRDGAIEDKCVADLGCGGGILGIGAHLLGSSYVVGFEIDPDAVRDFHENILNSLPPDTNTIDIVLCDVMSLEFKSKIFDTVILNPPFGTTEKSHGRDVTFLRKALSLAKEHVYSLHKTVTRKHILNTVRATGANCDVVAELRFDIPKLYKQHKHNSTDVAVDLVHSWFNS